VRGFEVRTGRGFSEGLTQARREVRSDNIDATCILGLEDEIVRIVQVGFDNKSEVVRVIVDCGVRFRFGKDVPKGNIHVLDQESNLAVYTTCRQSERMLEK